jgi:deoxyribonuclease IV
MKKVGLNLRLTTNMRDLIIEAQRLELPFFQSFLTFQENGSYIYCSEDEYQEFLLLKQDTPFYAHGSYRINLANAPYRNDSYYFLKKELELAKKLECSYLIMHPGSTTDCQDHNQGIDNVAKKINTVLKKGDYPTILLENVAFGKKVLGGDLHDLALIRSKIDKPEKVQFCIDTAHAFAYGYTIADSDEQGNFIDLMQKILGIDSIALIHLNDTREQLGSFRDRHDIPGQGNIGIEALKRFVNDSRLEHIPTLLELPILSEDVVKDILQQINAWRSNLTIYEDKSKEVKESVCASQSMDLAG